MKIKTSELTGPALRYAVAVANGYAIHNDGLLNGRNMFGWYIAGYHADPNNWLHFVEFNPDCNWAQGGPILDREHIATGNRTYGPASIVLDECYGIIGEDPDWGEHLFEQAGPTRLIAAMRCYVASKLGDEVDVPEELV
jgi:hypothetical protein